MASEWEVVTLGSLGSLKNGANFNSKDYGEDHPVVSVKSLFRGRFAVTEDLDAIKAGVLSNIDNYLLRHNDILFARSSLKRSGSGQSAIVNHPPSGTIFSGFTIRFRVHSTSEVFPLFIFYSFQSPKSREQFARIATGTTISNLSQANLNSVEIALPSFQEQKAIAHILGSLDDKIELNRQMNETLEAMSQALFKSWFVDFDPVIDNALAAGNDIPDEFAERAELRKGIKKKDNSDIQDLFPDAFEFTEEIGWIPKGWKSVRFADITEAKQGRYLASNKMTDLPDDKHIYPVWGGNEVRGFSEELLFDSPVVVLTCRGSNCGLLKITEAESWVTNSSFACTPKFGSAYFLYTYFSNDDFSQSISGSAQPQITYTALKNNLMKFPISEKVVENISMRLEVFRIKQIFFRKQSETLAKLRDTLLPKLMSGELRITDDIF